MESTRVDVREGVKDRGRLDEKWSDGLCENKNLCVDFSC